MSGGSQARRVERVLLVDDKEITLRSWQRELRQRGIESSFAHDLAGTMAAVQAREYQVAVVDLFLEDWRTGGESGLMVIQQLLEHAPSMAVFLVSADLPAKHAAYAMYLGCRWPFEKPVPWSLLLALAEGGSPRMPRADTVAFDLDARTRELFEKALIAEEGNVARTAQRLGMHRMSFRRKSEKLGVKLAPQRSDDESGDNSDRACDSRMSAPERADGHRVHTTAEGQLCCPPKMRNS